MGVHKVEVLGTPTQLSRCIATGSPTLTPGSGMRTPLLLLVCILTLSALPARPRVTRLRQIDRRTALQTAAAATVALVAVPPALAVKSQYTAATRASELQSGMLWIPKSDAPAKAAR